MDETIGAAWKLRMVARSMRATANARLEDTSLQLTQVRFLGVLHQLEPCTQSEVAQVLQISAPTVAISVKKLERDGFVKKSPMKEDLRSHTISLTPKGAKTIQKCQKVLDLLDHEIFAGFSAQELASISEYLQRMLHNLGVDSSMFPHGNPKEKPAHFQTKEPHE